VTLSPQRDQDSMHVPSIRVHRQQSSRAMNGRRKSLTSSVGDLDHVHLETRVRAGRRRGSGGLLVLSASFTALAAVRAPAGHSTAAEPRCWVDLGGRS